MEANTSRMINLNGSNYHVWKGKMEDLLYVKDYYLPIFSTKKPKNQTDAEWTILHRQGIISQLAGIGIKFEDEIQGLWLLVLSVILSTDKKNGHRFLFIFRCLGHEKGREEVKVEARVTESYGIKRLGHMSEKGMSILSKKNVLSGVHDINLKKCSHCLAGKQTRCDFKKRPSFRTVNILDQVQFRMFHTLVERKTGRKLNCIRSDNGVNTLAPLTRIVEAWNFTSKTPPKYTVIEWLGRDE
ncbi:retrovirus-related pol polyprotein from transposon TNT 1-94 [Tanacetum coccineum]